MFCTYFEVVAHLLWVNPLMHAGTGKYGPILSFALIIIFLKTLKRPSKHVVFIEGVVTEGIRSERNNGKLRIRVVFLAMFIKLSGRLFLVGFTC